MCVHSRFSFFDQAMMAQAIALAKQGLFTSRPNPAVGCVLVQAGQVIGQGFHYQAGLPHAEKMALQKAQENAPEKLAGSTAYVTLEPCSHYGKTPPCSLALIEARVARVMIAMRDPNPLVAGKGVEALQKAGIRVEVGLHAEQAYELNKGFIKRMEKQLPWVQIKTACSLDGRTAMANGESKWITGALARQQVHQMRAANGAIITGIGTVLADDPSLTVRLPADILQALQITPPVRQPLRVVIDASLNTPANAQLLKEPGQTLVMTSAESYQTLVQAKQRLCDAGAEVVPIPSQNKRLDLLAVLNYLATKKQINTVMVEAGPSLAGAFVASGCWDEMHVFMAPTLLGDAAKPLFALPGLEHISDKINLALHNMSRCGEDIRLIFTPK